MQGIFSHELFLSLMSSASSESAVVTGIMESPIADLANNPTVAEIACWCDVEERDDLAGLHTLLGAKATTQTRIFAAIRAALEVDNSEMAPSVFRLSQPDVAVEAGLMGALS